MRARHTIFVGLVITLVVAMVAGACSTSSKPTARSAATASTTKPAPAITTEAQLKTAIQHQGLTPERAEQYFALEIGPLPGVSVKGIKADPSDFDGTPAVLDLQAEWSHLSKAQQAAATKLMSSGQRASNMPSSTSTVAPGAAPTSTATTAPGAPSSTATSVPNGSSTSSSDTTATTVASRTGARPRYVLVAHAADAPPSDEILALAVQANATEAAATGQPPINSFIVDEEPVIAAAWAQTTMYYFSYVHLAFVPYDGDACHIEVFTPQWAGSDPESQAAVISHEVFHCFQQRLEGSNRAAASVHDWVQEGGATWVMAQLHPTASVVGPKWDKYIDNPTTAYYERSYDALGVFGHLGDVLGDQSGVWPRLLPAAVTDENGEDSKTFNQLISGHRDTFFETWGASYFLDSGGPDWHMGGPGPVSTAV